MTPIGSPLMTSGAPSQSIEGAPIKSTSSSSRSRMKTSGEASSGLPVLRTYSVSPRPGGLGAGALSHSSMK